MSLILGVFGLFSVPILDKLPILSFSNLYCTPPPFPFGNHFDALLFVVSIVSFISSSKALCSALFL
jgi:hypothetical protein